jgi:excisionase family DNA binding protein
MRGTTQHSDTNLQIVSHERSEKQQTARDHSKGVLKIAEVASELQCSKSHVYNIINGKVRGVSTLPAIKMGRRTLVRRCTLEQWLRENEHGVAQNATLNGSPEVDAVGRA